MYPSKSIATIFIILAMLAQACQPLAPTPTVESDVDPVQANIEVVRAYIEEVWNQDNLDALEKYLAPDFVFHGPPDIPPTFEGKKAQIAQAHATLSDIESVVLDIFGEDDLVVTRGAVIGNHIGSFMGEAPTGNRITVTGIAILRMADGKIVEEWEEADTVGLMTQLGIMPHMGPPMGEPVIEVAPAITEVDADQLARQREIAHRISMELWGQGNLDLIDEFYAPDLIYHNEPLSQQPATLEELAEEVTMVHNGVTDIAVTVHQVVVAGDRAAARWSVQGVHTGNLFGLPASGNPLAITGINIVRFADGKVVEEWVQQDVMSMLFQVGAIPPQGVVFAEDSDDIPTVTFIGTDFAFAGPETVPAGWVRVQMLNEGHDLHHAQLVRLDDGYTLDDLMAAMAADPEATPDWISFTGGPSVVVPGEGASVVMNLAPGNYVLICFLPDEGGIPHVAHGMIMPFQVVESDDEPAPAPEAPITMELFDHNFILSEPITPGRHIIRVVNSGPQPHEVTVVWLAPGATVESFLAAFEPGAEGPPPGKPIGGMQALDNGGEGYMTVEFNPGRYLLICFIPDEETGAPHFAHGMVQVITVR